MRCVGVAEPCLLQRSAGLKRTLPAPVQRTVPARAGEPTPPDDARHLQRILLRCDGGKMEQRCIAWLHSGLQNRSHYGGFVTCSLIFREVSRERLDPCCLEISASFTASTSKRGASRCSAAKRSLRRSRADTGIRRVGLPSVPPRRRSVAGWSIPHGSTTVARKSIPWMASVWAWSSLRQSMTSETGPKPILRPGAARCVRLVAWRCPVCAPSLTWVIPQPLVCSSAACSKVVSCNEILARWSQCCHVRIPGRSQAAICRGHFEER